MAFVFNNDIFNQYDDEMSYKDDERSCIRNSFLFKDVKYKILNEEPVSEEEAKFYFKYSEISEDILNKISKDVLIGINKHNLKYKVNSKEKLREIIETYSKKNPSITLNWIDTSNITDMSSLFYKMEYNGDISEWDVSNVTNMAGMFAHSKFNKDINGWDVSNVTNMACMFAYSKFNGDISKWDVSKVTNMACMFAESQFNGDISKWDVSEVTNMAGMFAYSKFNHNISSWKVSNEKLKDYMWGKL